jgi:hypothetical protein
LLYSFLLQLKWAGADDCGLVAVNGVSVAVIVGSYAILVIEWLLSAGEHSDQGLFATDASAGA